jgi:hypothetical protein
VYAFTEKEECSKEEKACGKDREITQSSQLVFMLVFFHIC